MENPTYSVEIELEKNTLIEFLLDEKDGKIAWKVTPNDNIVKITVFKDEDIIYEKWVFLKFVEWDVFELVLSLETVYDNSEVL